MKKFLICFTCCLAGMLSTEAQTLYGTTSNGGDHGVGTINKLTVGTNDFEVVYSPEGIIARQPQYTTLVQAANGKLYGMTAKGGVNDVGIIFSYDPSSATFTKLKDFDNTSGAAPYGSLMKASDGKLYGMTTAGGAGYGVIFSFDPGTLIYTKLRDFEPKTGINPTGDLIQGVDGKLYGTTPLGGYGLGVVFSFDPHTLAYKVINVFYGDRGVYPSRSLIQLADGKLYGTTSKTWDVVHGGDGLIFSLDPVTSAYTVLLVFDTLPGGKPGPLIQASNGKLYGLTYTSGNEENFTQGIIYSFDPVTSVFTVLKEDVGNPSGGLVQASDGKLYGLSSTGRLGEGFIFSFDPSTSVYTSLHGFNFSDGSKPLGNLMQATDGKLYGMTSGGGIQDAGVIFSFNPSASVYTKLKDFGDNESGSNMAGEMVLASNGKLYGLTANGGAHGTGVIFSYDTSSSTYLKLKDFGGAEGDHPGSSLIQASDGKLYGMTSAGGTAGVGVIFSYDPAASIYKVLKNFSGQDGAAPHGTLTELNGKLYGMATLGGTEYTGVIFSFDPATLSYKKLKDLTFETGKYPWGSLLAASDGNLYGLTSSGGSDFTNAGTLFSIDPATLIFKVLFRFDNTNGANPGGTLIQASDGRLYGTTPYSSLSARGEIFSYNLSLSVLKKRVVFDDANKGYTPIGAILQASNGKIYGSTRYGGAYNFGVIYSFDPATNTYSKLKDFDGPHGRGPSNFVEVPECTTNTAYYADADGDDYGDPYKWKIAVSKPKGYVANNRDCDDKNKAVHPETYYLDADGDFFGDANVSITLCGQAIPAGYVKNKNDDDDHQKLDYNIVNYPNPFKGTSVIKYALPFDSKVSVVVYDLSGKPIATLVNDNKKAGFYTINFNVGNLSAGTLYYKITAESKDQHFEQTNKMVLLR